MRGMSKAVLMASLSDKAECSIFPPARSSHATQQVGSICSIAGSMRLPVGQFAGREHILNVNKKSSLETMSLFISCVQNAGPRPASSKVSAYSKIQRHNSTHRFQEPQCPHKIRCHQEMSSNASSRMHVSVPVETRTQVLCIKAILLYLPFSGAYGLC